MRNRNLRKRILCVFVLAVITGTLAVPLTANNARALPWDPPFGDFLDFDVDIDGNVTTMWVYQTDIGGGANVGIPQNTWGDVELSWYWYQQFKAWIDNLTEDLDAAYWQDTTWIATGFQYMNQSNIGANAIITTNLIKANAALAYLELQIGNMDARANRTVNMVVLSYAIGLHEFSRNVNKQSIKDVSMLTRAEMYKEFFDNFVMIIMDLADIYEGTYTMWDGFFTKAQPYLTPIEEQEVDAINKNIKYLGLRPFDRKYGFYYESVDDVTVGMSLANKIITRWRYDYYKNVWLNYILRGQVRARVINAKTGQPVQGALITLTHRTKGTKAQKATDDNGEAVFDLPQGDYFVSITKTDYMPVESDTKIYFLQEEEKDYTMEQQDIYERNPIWVYGGWAGLIILIFISLAVIWRNRDVAGKKLANWGKEK